jgi:hypothetical protein
VLFDLADLNPSWAYVALGHVHRPQTIGGSDNVRYCGSLDRLDFGETHDEYGVLLVEVGRTGLAGHRNRCASRRRRSSPFPCATRRRNCPPWPSGTRRQRGSERSSA